MFTHCESVFCQHLERDWGHKCVPVRRLAVRGFCWEEPWPIVPVTLHNPEPARIVLHYRFCSDPTPRPAERLVPPDRGGSYTERLRSESHHRTCPRQHFDHHPPHLPSLNFSKKCPYLTSAKSTSTSMTRMCSLKQSFTTPIPEILGKY